MNSFFAAVFSDRSAAENARRFIEKMHEKNELKILSAVIINKEQDGEVRLKNATTPGALGARLGGVIGGILGLIGGPLVAMAGAAGGALSGGWFDLMRADEREIFLKEVSYKISVGNFALLAEVVDPSDEAKAMVRSHVEECGGSLLLKDR